MEKISYIKNLRDEKPAVYCCFLVFCVTIIIFTSIYPIAMIVIGAQNQNLCPIEPKIPIWLIVQGSVAIFFSLLSILTLIASVRQWKLLGGIVTFFNAIATIFLFAWFIAGNVWVYSNSSKVQFDSTSQTSTYCDKTAYLFSFWTITVSYIVLGLTCIIGLLVCCCVCICGVACFGLASKK